MVAAGGAGGAAPGGLVSPLSPRRGPEGPGLKTEYEEGEIIEEGSLAAQGAFQSGTYGPVPGVGHHFPGRDDPHAGLGYAAVPPPSCLDASGPYGKGKGYKGKGKGKGGFDPAFGEGPRLAPSDGLIVTSIPPEFNTLPLLHRHFRQFGEVVKITSHSEEGKAYVQFADRVAAQGAASVPVFDRPDIVMAWAPKAAVKGGGRPKGEGKGKDGPPEKPVENRVLVADPEEQSRLNESKRRKDEVQIRKAQLLGKYTEQMKTIMTKLADDSVSEGRREAMRTLLLQIKEKMDALGGLGLVEELPRPKGKGKGKKGKGWIMDDEHGKGYPPGAAGASAAGPGLRGVKDDPNAKEEEERDEKPLAEVSAAPDAPGDGDADAAELGGGGADKADDAKDEEPGLPVGAAASSGAGPAAAAPAPPAAEVPRGAAGGAGAGDLSPKSEEETAPAASAGAAAPAVAGDEPPDAAPGIEIAAKAAPDDEGPQAAATGGTAGDAGDAGGGGTAAADEPLAEGEGAG